MPIEVCGQKGVPIKEFGCSFPLELPGYCAGSKNHSAPRIPLAGGAVLIFPSLQASRPNARDAARSELTQLDEQEPEIIVRHRDVEVRKAGA